MVLCSNLYSDGNARHSIPLIPAELIGYYMGLVVPEEELVYFWNGRTGEMPPAGYGTQASKAKYGPNAVFKKLKIPLKMNWSLIDDFPTLNSFYVYLEKISSKDLDVLVCYDWGTLFDADYDGGHVCVLDTVDVRTHVVRIIDPEYKSAKWKTVQIKKLYESMLFHGKAKCAGFWEISLIDIPCQNKELH